MKLNVMQFDSVVDCKKMAVKFNIYVINLFEQMGYELNEQIVWPSGKTLKIDKAYLKNWLKFESLGY